jgi:hypothetical protein
VSDWRTVLEPTPECIEIARLGDELTPREREHLAGCVRCQSELALMSEVMSEESSPESRAIAAELRRRNNIASFRPRVPRLLYAMAAALAIVVGTGTWMQLREPSADLGSAPPVYRSARLETIAPSGELASAPNELRWNSVPKVSRYHVRIVEVDATELWSADTAETHIVLPPHVIAQFAPGKTLLWDVKAIRGNEIVAASDTQNVRVSVSPRNDR